MKSLRRGALVFVLAVFAFPASAYADVIWPAAMLSGRLLSWWAIGLGLLIEWPAVRWLLRRGWIASLWATVLMNAASAFLGMILVPVGGLVIDMVWFAAMRGALGGSFSPAGWLRATLVAAAISTAVEAGVLTALFKCNWSKSKVVVLADVNVASTSIALGSFYLLHPPSEAASVFLPTGVIAVCLLALAGLTAFAAVRPKGRSKDIAP